LAAEWAGIETVAFCEIEPYCQQVLMKHWPDVPIYNDVRELTRERLEQDGVIGNGRTIDLICGGYPCQPFSVAGKRRGTKDDRHLWPEMFRLVRELRPTWVLGENVAGHVSLGLDDVLSDLESAGYKTRAFIIPAAAVGAPHRRDRVFVVAYSEGEQDRRGEQPRIQSDIGANGQNVADTASEGLSQRRQSGFAKAEKETETGMESKPQRCGENVANPYSAGREKCDITSCSTELGQYSRCIDEKWIQSLTRATQPRLGGVLDGISDWLDGCRWPAPLGRDQYDWEPPRVVVGSRNRASRLKALGNAVVPQQVYPILAAIKAVHELLHTSTLSTY